MKKTTILFLLILLPWSHVLPQGSDRKDNLRVVNYDFTIFLPSSGNEIHACAVLSVVRCAAESTLIIDLSDLRIDSVHLNGKSSAFKRHPATLELILTKSARRSADTLSLSIWYGGEVKDGLIIQTDRQGRWMAFGDNWPDRARHWLPVIDRPDAKATVSWPVIAPADRKVVANGRLVEQRAYPPDDRMTSVPRMLTRWKTDRPIPPYLMVIAVGPLQETDLGLTARGLSEFPPGVPQSVYAVPEVADYLPGPFAEAGNIVSLFSKLVAPFPYEKLAHVQSFTRYGGMENASAIFYADGVFLNRSVSAGLIAHETAHQWFGDAVTPRSWGHLWLSEGFASYFEQIWVERNKGKEAFQSGMKRLRTEVLGSKVTSGRPVVDTLETNLLALLNTNSYQKGAWTLHMLRSMLGDSVFFRAIQEYYRQFRHVSANTDDLCSVFDCISGRSLRWFFDQWLRRPGVANLKIKWRYVERSGELRITVEQSSSYAPYRLRLPVTIVTSEGGRVREQFDVPALNSVDLKVPYRSSASPAQVLFDPDVELLASIEVFPEQ